MTTPTQRSLTVAIIIPTFNRGEALCKTIEQLEFLTSPADEIIVVDQSPEQPAAVAEALVAFQDMGLIRLLTLKDANLPAARNEGAVIAKSDVLIYIDDDVTVDPTFVRRHELLHLDDGVAAVCGQVFEPAHRDEFPSFDWSSAIKRANCYEHFSITERRDVDFLRGCHFSVKRDAWRSIGGFDVAFVGAANGEESDFANRLLDSQQRITFDPECQLVHWKLPSGGCRIPGNGSTAEWKKTASMLLYGIRYSSRLPEARGYFWRALRAGPFRRENVIRPWRLPTACASFIYALGHAWLRASRLPHRPTLPTGKGQTEPRVRLRTASHKPLNSKDPDRNSDPRS